MALRPLHDDSSNRALLFGAHQRRPQRAALGVASASEQESLEQQNNEAVDGLRGRVGEMRHLAINMGTEMQTQNTLLDGMGDTFDNAGTALNRTIMEVRRLASSGSGGHMCAMAVFTFVFFLLVWLLLR